MEKSGLVIFTGNNEFCTECEEIARKLNIRLLYDESEAVKSGSYLKMDENGLSFVSGKQTIRGDFSKLIPRIKPNNLGGELLIKSAKFKEKPSNPLAVDMTAGLGEDSFLLSAYGYRVIMFEKDEIIALLLADALKRGVQTPQISDIVQRMTLIVGNSIEEIGKIKEPVDIVYLDPMFPQRSKSGLVKKKFQVIHGIEKPCENGEELLNSALSVSPRRIIIKRPKKGEILGKIKPSYTLDGNSIRYDVIVK